MSRQKAKKPMSHNLMYMINDLKLVMVWMKKKSLISFRIWIVTLQNHYFLAHSKSCQLGMYLRCCFGVCFGIGSPWRHIKTYLSAFRELTHRPWVITRMTTAEHWHDDDDFSSRHVGLEPLLPDPDFDQFHRNPVHMVLHFGHRRQTTARELCSRLCILSQSLGDGCSS